MPKRIDPCALYTRAELIDLLGDSAMRRLDIRAIGDRYLGKVVLDALERAHHDALNSQGASARMKGGEKTDAPHNMEENLHRSGNSYDRLAKHRRLNPVSSQIEKLGAQPA